MGNVPPFGHRTRLPVFVDSAVTAFANCYAGGGSDAAEIRIAVPELLRAAAATVADISIPATSSCSSSTDPSSNSSNGSSQSTLAEAAAEQRAAAAEQRAAAVAAAATLPLPWQPGAGGEEEEVTLEGVVAHKRKIARLLLFANLVPLSALVDSSIGSPAGGSSSGGGQGSGSGSSGSPGTASYMRRLWRHPDTQVACEVQLIMGKTLERRLGR